MTGWDYICLLFTEMTLWHGLVNGAPLWWAKWYYDQKMLPTSPWQLYLLGILPYPKLIFFLFCSEEWGLRLLLLVLNLLNLVSSATANAISLLFLLWDWDPSLLFLCFLKFIKYFTNSIDAKKAGCAAGEGLWLKSGTHMFCPFWHWEGFGFCSSSNFLHQIGLKKHVPRINVRDHAYEQVLRKWHMDISLIRPVNLKPFMA